MILRNSFTCFSLLSFVAFTLVACGGGSPTQNAAPNADTASTTVSIDGAGVKGPMAGANVQFYEVDPDQPLFYHEAFPVGSATTGSDGTFHNVTLQTDAAPPFIVVVDGSDALDVHTGRSPVMPQLVTLVTAEDFAARRPIYVTPLTTLTILTARAELFAGTDVDAVLAVVDAAADEVRDNFGFGLLRGIDILRDAAMLNDAVNTAQAQAALTRHRAAIEAISAVLYQLGNNIAANNAAASLNNNEIYAVAAALARDLAADGIADGRVGSAVLTEIDPALLKKDPATLTVPDTDILIADLADILQAEASLQNLDIPLYTDSMVVTAGGTSSTGSTTTTKSGGSTTTTKSRTSTTTTKASTTSTTKASTTSTTKASTSTTKASTTSTTKATTSTTTTKSTTTSTTAPKTTTTTIANAVTTVTPKYYVDRNNTLANDNNPGTSSLPFKTISRAAAVAIAGDTVLVKAGTYPESVDIVHSGTSTQPITFVASGTVIVSPPTMDNYTGVFNILGKNDIVISGFTVRNAYYGFRVAPGSGLQSQRITIRNNHATYTRSSGINVTASRDVTVEGNVVEKTNYGGVHEMITIAATNGFLVKDNEVFNGTFIMNGVAMEGKEGIDAKSGSSNGRIVGNKVHDLVRLGIYADSWSSLEQNIQIVGNTIYNCRDGIALSSELNGTLKNILIANNIAYNNRTNGIVISTWGTDGPREDIRIYNNTLYGNGDGGGLRIATNNIVGLHIKNNIGANNGGPAFFAENVGLVTASSNNLTFGKNGGNILSGLIEGDPAFVGASTANFRLGSASAAINRGTALGEVPTDFGGRARPQGGVYDIGAFESY